MSPAPDLLAHDQLETGMFLQSRKPAHPTHGDMWFTVRVGKITEHLVELILVCGCRDTEVHFIGFRCEDGNVRDDSDSVIELRLVARQELHG